MIRRTVAPWILVGAVAVLFLLTVWPTPYRYFSVESPTGRQTVARENRITGQLEFLTSQPPIHWRR